MKNLFAASLLGAVLALTLGPVAQAQVLAVNGSDESFAQSPTAETAYDGFITSNLLTGLTPSSTVTPNLGFPLGGINDGGADANVIGASSKETWFEGGASFDGSNPHELNSNPVVTFTFNTSIHTLGYTITSLQSIYGWNDENSYNDQDFTITGTYVGGGSFTLGSVAYNPFDPSGDQSGSGLQAATMVNGSITGLTGVKSISFEFTPYISPSSQEQAGQMIREIQLFGGATAVVPEPGTWALLVSGLLFMIMLSARRRRLADKA
jgi:hypothetical protein